MTRSVKRSGISPQPYLALLVMFPRLLCRAAESFLDFTLFPLIPAIVRCCKPFHEVPHLTGKNHAAENSQPIRISPARIKTRKKGTVQEVKHQIDLAAHLKDCF